MLHETLGPVVVVMTSDSDFFFQIFSEYPNITPVTVYLTDRYKTHAITTVKKFPQPSASVTPKVHNRLHIILS
jgi:hypothetical protein